jgi:hypothetical protein
VQLVRELLADRGVVAEKLPQTGPGRGRGLPSAAVAAVTIDQGPLRDWRSSPNCGRGPP